MVDRPLIDSETRVSPEPNWHALSVESVRDMLQSDLERGLTQGIATRRLATYGPNTLAHTRERSAVSMLAAQFRSLIVALLVVAAVVAVLTGEFVDASAILVVILLNAAIGFATEWKARQALSALQKQSARVAHVIRDGTAREVPAAGLVPGDLIVVSAGDRVSADGRIVDGARLQIEEAALTGESLAVDKTPDRLPDGDVVLADRRNMVFLGTTVTAGRGKVLVTATGARSEVGKIGVLIDEASVRTTPLEQKLAKLGRLLVVAMMALCSVIVLAGWIRGAANLGQMLQIGLSLAVAAVPEGLPAVTTMSLAIGMQRMARMRALVRRLPAVETLGSVTVICTDKTGTLTKNEMTVRRFVLDGQTVDVSGTGYAVTGTFQRSGVAFEPSTDEALHFALRIGALCNDAKVDRAGGRDTVLGDPTEAALIVVAEKAGLEHAALQHDFPRQAELPFDSDSKRMVTIHRTPQGSTMAFVKGAPGALLRASSARLGDSGVVPLADSDRQHWERANENLAGAALRVLGLAYRELPDAYSAKDLGQDLVFVGLVGMSDPLRDEVKAAVSTCREAGIRTIMITGDQPATAAEIARQLGIDGDCAGHRLRTVHGRELKDLDQSGWENAVNEAAVFARVSPQHKLEIVETLQRQGHIVAMTGDGVNDAPALKKADIGIAMVITDDNFASIVSAVEQGRIIYGNIRRFLHYLLSCNFSEILTIFLALMIGWPLPLGVLQILWLNLITDVFPAFALALEPSAPDAMKRPPRNPNEPLVSARFMGLIAWQGLLLAGVTLFAFGIGLRWHGLDGEDHNRAATMAFMTLALAQIFHVFSARSQRNSAFSRRLLVNPWLLFAVAGCLTLQLTAIYVPFLQRALHTVSPTFSEWIVIAACSLAPVVVVELTKWARRTLLVLKNQS